VSLGEAFHSARAGRRNDIVYLEALALTLTLLHSKQWSERGLDRRKKIYRKMRADAGSRPYVPEPRFPKPCSAFPAIGRPDMRSMQQPLP
jgi:hypothetical protein